MCEHYHGAKSYSCTARNYIYTCVAVCIFVLSFISNANRPAHTLPLPLQHQGSVGVVHDNKDGTRGTSEHADFVPQSSSAAVGIIQPVSANPQGPHLHPRGAVGADGELSLAGIISSGGGAVAAAATLVGPEPFGGAGGIGNPVVDLCPTTDAEAKAAAKSEFTDVDEAHPFAFKSPEATDVSSSARGGGHRPPALQTILTRLVSYLPGGGGTGTGTGIMLEAGPAKNLSWAAESKKVSIETYTYHV